MSWQTARKTETIVTMIQVDKAASIIIRSVAGRFMPHRRCKASNTMIASETQSAVHNIDGSNTHVLAHSCRGDGTNQYCGHIAKLFVSLTRRTVPRNRGLLQWPLSARTSPTRISVLLKREYFAGLPWFYHMLSELR
ncbi:hypothetical protein CY34DRAFT_240841 [Suillus luteus UH-Slu-Lm8-n1]|uniref:Uncharacterized protein n=1 Tax=Suillus luteus UH-Slu-Lm8-n1 TaxID=930992 RepID=A0A0D0BBJ9_9AGAM|nr:hypothetical protein CY34DRAFT_240841 [Suillus luteus UH-Slu-Lm8-n1]